MAEQEGKRTIQGSTKVMYGSSLGSRADSLAASLCPPSSSSEAKTLLRTQAHPTRMRPISIVTVPRGYKHLLHIELVAAGIEVQVE